MFKQFLFLISFSFLAFFSNAQILEPVKWTMSMEQLSESEYNLVYTANAEKPWVVYSQHTEGASPTIITYEDQKDVSLVGEAKEFGHKKEGPDKLFDNEVVIKYLSDKPFVIKQKIKVTGPNPIAKGYIEYMTCDNTKCIGGLEADFNFNLRNSDAEIKSNVPKGIKDVKKSTETGISNFTIKNVEKIQSKKSGIFEPIKWSTEKKKISDTEYELTFTAKMDKPWVAYSQHTEGAEPTIITYEEKNDVELDGKSKEFGHKKEAPDKMFENAIVIKYLPDEPFVIKQKIKITGPNPSLKGYIEYMSCDDTKCIGGLEYDFSFDISQGNNNASSSDVDVDNKDNNTDNAKDKGKTNEKDGSGSRGLFTIFFLAFLSGFAALLTPCVFPMIPMTVSYFTKQSKSKAQGIRNAIIYGISIIVIYVLLGTGVTAIFGADALNALSTNVWFNIIFFLLLVVFAASFLGAFEIMLPSSWANKIDSQADRGGMIGIFFMALALAIVSFSCTGPIVGTLLVEAASKGGIAPIVGMLGFSLALALPFALFAAFPGWMNSLPRSGGWLNTVKVVLGFLELALAFKFLSNADLVLELHWLEREVFLAIWITIFGTLAFYLFGKLQLPHDSPVTSISVGRLSLAIVTMTFTIYMIPGLWGAPLNLISAFPPPQHYSESPYGVGFSKLGGGGGGADHASIPDGAHLMAPHDILAFNDYDKGLAYAKKVNKPVMIDFTGKACVNCRKMEQNVWVKPNIIDVLKNDVVLISLYVDDKRPLKEDEVIPSKLKPGKNLRYIGQKWSELQTIKYENNSQPYYILMDHNEDNLIDPVGYTPNVEEYFGWLKEGVSKF